MASAWSLRQQAIQPPPPRQAVKARDGEDLVMFALSRSIMRRSKADVLVASLKRAAEAPFQPKRPIWPGIAYYTAARARAAVLRRSRTEWIRRWRPTERMQQGLQALHLPAGTP